MNGGKTEAEQQKVAPWDTETLEWIPFQLKTWHSLKEKLRLLFVYNMFAFRMHCICNWIHRAESLFRSWQFLSWSRTPHLRNPNFRYLNPQIFPNLSQMNAFHFLLSHYFKTILILYSCLRLSLLSYLFSSNFNTKPSKHFSFPNTCHMPRPSHSLSFDHANVWKGVDMKLLTV